jgi:hypothetical protein
MLVLYSIRRRMAGAIGVAATTAFVLMALSGSVAAQPVPTGPTDWPVIELANPGPGAVLSAGDYIISGSAYDPAAASGAGITRVDVFLGSRDAGGEYLGSAIPGQNSMSGITPGTPLGASAFQLKVSLPSSVAGGEDLYAYAYSVDGKETAFHSPVFIGVVPTATPSDATVAKPQAEMVRMFAPAVANGAEMFSLGNPSRGDIVLNGDYMVSGSAGSAIDRVELFLDNRDTGAGTHLATVVPVNGQFSTVVTIPAGTSGGHTFMAYARSALTGQEIQVAVPVFIGAAPTPTPRPTS